jgi:hypothetical protein
MQPERCTKQCHDQVEGKDQAEDDKTLDITSAVSGTAKLDIDTIFHWA